MKRKIREKKKKEVEVEKNFAAKNKTKRKLIKNVQKRLFDEDEEDADDPDEVPNLN